MGLKVALACGGTGGHVFPALAVGRALWERHGAELVMIGRRDGMETKWASEAGIPYRGIRTVPLQRSRVWNNVFLPLRAYQALAEAKEVLRAEKPDVVFATGGYVSLPTGAAAKRAGIPLVVHESNSHPGIANRLLARMADMVFTGSPAGAAKLPNGVAVGNPVRPLDGRSRAQMRQALGLSESDKFLVVVGGSQGARGINRLMAAEARSFSQAGWKVLWQAGAGGIDLARQSAEGIDGLRAEAFVTDMYGAFGAADLALTRSGASTLAELALFGLPSVLVPFPSATGNHQEINAREFSDAGAASLLIEAGWRDGDGLRAVEALWARRAQASAAMKSFARPHCAAELADAVAKAAGRTA